MTDKSNYKLDSQTIHKQFSIRAYEEKQNSHRKSTMLQVAQITSREKSVTPASK